MRLIRTLRLNFILLTILLLFFVFTRNFEPLYAVNQNEYYVHAFARVNNELLQNDWFVKTQPKHEVFVAIIETLYSLNIAQFGSQIIQVVLETVYYVALFIIARFVLLKTNFRNRLTEQQANLFALTIIFLMIVARESDSISWILSEFDYIFDTALLRRWITFQFWIFDGFAAQRILEGHLLPSEFGVFILLAIAFALHNYWRTSALLLALTVNLHFSYSIHCGVLILILIGWLLWKKERNLSFQLFMIFSLIVLPITLHSVVYLSDSSASQVNEFLVLDVWAAHSLPSQFWGLGHTIKLLIMIISAILLYRYKVYFLATLVSTTTLAVSIGTLYVHIASDYTVALMFPWRASAYLVPMTMVIASSIMIQVTDFIPSSIRLYIGRFLLIFAILLVLLDGINLINEKSAPNEKLRLQEFIFEKISESTSLDDIILVPLDPPDHLVAELDNLIASRFWGFARIGTQRSIYVDTTSVPMLGSDVIEWRNRIEFVDMFYQQSFARQLELCKEQDIDFFIRESPDNISDDIPIINIERFYLISCE